MSESLELLWELSAKPAAVQWFSGLFRCAHVAVTDTGEEFTVRHRGNHCEVTPGLSAERPNFIVPVERQNLRNLTEFFGDDAINPYEEYRIVKFMLRPCLEASLAMPILQNGAIRKIVRVDTHWHEALLTPDGDEDERLTIIFANDQWLVFPGYHGKPQRRLVMKPEQTLEYQRHLFAADEANKLSTWLEFARWYKSWRDTVSVPV
jgi:hypothetical protein